MKKLISSLLSFLLILSILPMASAASHADSVYDAIESTLNSPYINVGVEGELKNGKNILSFTESLKDSLKAQKVNAQLKLDFSIANLPKAFQKESDMDFSIKASAEAESFFDKETEDAYGSLTDFVFKATSSDPETLKIIEGFAEYPKLFTEKVFHVNAKNLTKTLTELSQEDIANLVGTKDDIKMLFKALLSSGVFTVNLVNSNVYEITLTTDAKKVDFIKLMSNLKQVPLLKNNPDFQTMIASMPEKIDETTLAELNESLETFRKYVTIKTMIYLEADKISTVEHFITIDLKKIVDDNNFENYDTTDIKNIEFYEKMTFTYNEVDIAYNPVAKHTININKIVESVDALSKKAQAKYDAYTTEMNNTEEWPTYEETMTEESTEDSGYTEVEPIMATPADVESLLKNIDTNAWYYENANNLAKKGILSSLGTANPTSELTEHKLYGLLLYAGGQVDYTLKGSSRALTKLEAIKIIVKAFYPEVNNPIKFAVDNQIIKTANVNDLKNSIMIEAEVYKVLDKTLQTLN